MDHDTFVLFELGGAHYALPSRDVQHIEMLEHITPVPNTAAFVEGVIFSRGQVIPAMNLRVRFGFPKAPYTTRTRIIIAQSMQRVVALIVDAAREFRSIPQNTIRPIEETLTGIDENYLQGVATIDGRLVLILNLKSVLSVVLTATERSAPELRNPHSPASHLEPSVS